MVDTLAQLAGPGPALELGIGTGRAAPALASHKVAVHGIDASQAMIEKLPAKPGASQDDQVCCFANCAARLKPAGAF